MTRLVLVLGTAALLGGMSAAADAPPVPTPIGAGRLFHPSPTNAVVSRGLVAGSLACTRERPPRWGAHLELFARGRVVIVPAGIGVAPPLRRRGVYVRSGRCSYAVRTREPTGVIEIDRSARVTLGEFFTVWGRPLSLRRLVGFTAAHGEAVRAYVDGRRWHSDHRTIPLRRHAEIVLELGSFVPPHGSYRFPKGL
jgi:hypothetical protein